MYIDKSVQSNAFVFSPKKNISIEKYVNLLCQVSRRLPMECRLYTPYVCPRGYCICIVIVLCVCA